MVVGTNSWVSVAEADNYLNQKLNTTSWATANKEGALVSAFYEIYNDPSLLIPKNSTNEKVKNAQIELAFWLVENITAWNKRKSLQSMGVKEFDIDNVKEVYNKNSSLPTFIDNMLQDFKSGGTIATFSRSIDD